MNKEEILDSIFMIKKFCEQHTSCPDCELFDNNHKECELNGIPTGWSANISFEPHWEEFEIDKDSHQFLANNKFYFWWQWQKFLTDNHERYNAFGGWLYQDSMDVNRWTTAPFFMNRRESITTTDLRYDESKPIYPNEIRFWRCKK